MAVAIAGGIAPQAAAWLCDLGSLYVGAIAYEEAIWTQRENSNDNADEGGGSSAAPRRVVLRIAPAEATYVCIDNGSGKVLFEGVISEPQTWRGRRLRLNGTASIAPAERRCRTSARVSTSSSATTSCFASQAAKSGLMRRATTPSVQTRPDPMRDGSTP